LPKIKICGITNLADARAVAKLEIDFLGLNFFAKSKRFLKISEAADLTSKIKIEFPSIQLVGVFVNAEIENVRKIAEICQLDILQFHGLETPEFCSKFTQKVWRVFRVRDENSLADLEQFLFLQGVVLDAFKKGEFGGTGQTFDWKLIHQVRDKIPNLILSGGINAKNIKKAIRQLKPNVIDICSGVENAGNPRKKSLEKIREIYEIFQ
jgi:phosphoribosylanthranilate isomerase